MAELHRPLTSVADSSVKMLSMSEHMRAGAILRSCVSGMRNLRSARIKRVALVVLVLVVFLYFRRDRILTFSVANPDEAELLASGRRAMQSMVPYERFTSPTYGPAWALGLGLLGRLGFPLSLPFAHLLSAVISATTCALTAYVALRHRGTKFAALSIAPLVVYWGFGFNHQDYWSLSTEQLPMLIILVGCAIASLGWSSNKWILVGAAFVGFGTWSKYLFGLVGLSILLTLTLRLCRRGLRWYRAVAAVLLASNAVTLLFYLLALAKGVPLDSVLESVEMTIDYIRGGGAGGMGDIPSVPLTSRLSALGSGLLTFVPLLPLVLDSLRDASVRLKRVDGRRFPTLEVSELGGPFIVVSGLITLCASPIIFPHYNYILITSCLAAFMTCLPETLGQEKYPKELISSRLFVGTMRLNLTALFVVLLVVSPSFGGVTRVEPSISLGQILSEDKGRWERAFDDQGNPLSEVCGPDSYAFVWGWSPEVYAFYDWRPASRFVAPAGMIDGNNLNLEVGPLREKLTRELLDEAPDCVVDAIGPSFFPGYGPDASMKKQMPSLWNTLSKNGVERIYYWDRVNPVLVLIRGRNELGPEPNMP